MPHTQENRLLGIETVLGPGTLLLQSFKGIEAISKPFCFELEMLSESTTLNLDTLVGQKTTIRVTLPDGGERLINGYINRFSQGESSYGFSHYNAQLVPWLSLLKLKTNCRIFQNQTVPEIIKKVFKESGVMDLSDMLQGSYQPLDYCVQYRETDFNFVSRLMEQYGIFYFFKHTENQHTMVIADSAAAHPSGPDAKVGMVSKTDLPEQSGITHWETTLEMRSGRYTLWDHNFELTNTLEANADTTIKLPGIDAFELYDYPGLYKASSEGEKVVKLRMQEHEAGYKVITGSGKTCALIPGHKFNLTGHYRREQDGAYLVTEVQHLGSAGTGYVRESQAELKGETYSNEFRCIPFATPFRPERVIPAPVMHGCQTATVVGPGGEEIYVDKYGRVEVQFHWDREGKYNESSSCWMRVATAWAGKQWGTIVIPRIGWEVVVAFEEGDVNRPFIIGCLYNAAQMPPYTLPDQKTQSGIKSLSSKGGSGYNEIRFEDKKGSEQIVIHAERDLETFIKKDRYEKVKEDYHLTVEKDQYAKITGDSHLQVTGDQNQKIDGTVSLKAGMDWQNKVGMKYALDAGMEIHLKSGMNLMIESGVALTLKVGGNFINLNPAGVFISGTMVMINSGGAAGSGSGASPSAPTAPTVPVEGQAGQVSKTPPPPRPPRPVQYSAKALMMKKAATDGSAFCDT